MRYEMETCDQLQPFALVHSARSCRFYFGLELDAAIFPRGVDASYPIGCYETNLLRVRLKNQG